MLDLVRATRFDRVATAGRTKPCWIACQYEDDEEEIECLVKLSAGCDSGVSGLVREAVAAMAATDLGLPVPEPFLVMMTPEFIDSMSDASAKRHAANSSPVAFGSKKLPPGFAVWPRGRTIPQAIRQIAADVLAFDAFIENVDRRPDNPNCQFKGDEIAIYDHDLAFPQMIIGGQPPWKPGALQRYREPGAHLFSDELRQKQLDFGRLRAAWQAISDQRLAEYRRAIPPAWEGGADTLERAIGLIAAVRVNIIACLAEVARALG